MLDSFNYCEDYLPLRNTSFNGENLGVLLFEGYRGVELSHISILSYFVTKVERKSKLHDPILNYVSKTLSLGLDGKISEKEVLRGRGNTAKKKILPQTDLIAILGLRNSKEGDLKYFYEKISNLPHLVGYTSASNIERIHRKEKLRLQRLLKVKIILDEIVDINLNLNLNPHNSSEQQHSAIDLHSKLKEIYKTPNKLW
jgi:hypothetical protein